jgi:hypothetical protein
MPITKAKCSRYHGSLATECQFIKHSFREDAFSLDVFDSENKNENEITLSRRTLFNQIKKLVLINNSTRIEDLSWENFEKVKCVEYVISTDHVDLSFLARLPSFKCLTLRNSTVKPTKNISFSGIENLIGLTCLTITDPVKSLHGLEYCQNLTSLTVEIPEGSHGFEGTICHLTSLQNLNIFSSKNDCDCTFLSNLTNLCHLSLNYKCITNIESLKNLDQMRNFTLTCHSQVGSIEFLKCFAQLEELYLNCKVRNGGLILKQLPSLRKIHLNGYYETIELESLHISNENIYIHVNTDLITISNIVGLGGICFDHFVKRPQHTIFSLSNCPDLTYLDISDCKNVKVSNCPLLDFFKFSNSESKIAGSLEIRDCPSIGVCQIIDIGLESFTDIQGLNTNRIKKLSVDGNPLQNLLGLENLDLHTLKVTNCELTSLQGLGNISELDISSNPILTIEDLPSCKLQNFRADECQISSLEPLKKNIGTLKVFSANNWEGDKEMLDEFMNYLLDHKVYVDNWGTDEKFKMCDLGGVPVHDFFTMIRQI